MTGATPGKMTAFDSIYIILEYKNKFIFNTKDCTQLMADAMADYDYLSWSKLRPLIIQHTDFYHF